MDLIDDGEPLPTDEETSEEEAFEKWMNGDKDNQNTTIVSSSSSSLSSSSSASSNKRLKAMYGSLLNQVSNTDKGSSSSSSDSSNDAIDRMSNGDGSNIVVLETNGHDDDDDDDHDAISMLTEDLIYYRNKIASQLNLTLMMMNATYQLDALDVHRKIINKRLTPTLEGLMDEQSTSSTSSVSSSSTSSSSSSTNQIKLFRIKREVYIKSRAFKLDENSTDLFYIIEDPSTDDDDDDDDDNRGRDAVDEDKNNLPISSTRRDTLPWVDSSDTSSSSSDSTGGGKGNKVGWAVTDSTQVQPGMKGQRQKLLVSVSTNEVASI